jgi:hypothetical protein
MPPTGGDPSPTTKTLTVAVNPVAGGRARQTKSEAS